MQNSRWGGVARGSDSESRAKPQEQSACDLVALQVRAGSSVNDTGTCEKSDTGLTQPAVGLFAECSAVIEALKAWVRDQEGPAAIHGLILTRSLSTYLKHPSDSLRRQIAENTARLSACVGR